MSPHNYLQLFRNIPITSRLLIIRQNCQTTAPRVRFAPSPTGYLHLGGLRTALYNYLFAKSRGGTFILRIEDTDQSRKVDGAVDGIVRDLTWAGVEYHEGADKGGNYGPYVQSERLDIYQKHVQELIEHGSAYYCFCTERRLNLVRRDAIRTRQMPKYDNKCRNLTPGEVNEKMNAGTLYCVRFKLSSDCQCFEDMIFGNIAYDVSLNEGDPVIMKADGYPTYHFANVIDDHLMDITHVLRGVEWQISTTKHILLYKAFGWSPPQYGHLPLIVNSDGTKLSKRQSDITVDDYKKNGTLPLALVNYITLSGGGFDHVPGAGVRLKTMDELAHEFKIGNVSSHPSRLNVDLLQECNRLELNRRLGHHRQCGQLIEDLQRLIKSKYPNENLNISSGHIRNVLKWSTNRITKIDDLVAPKFAFLWIVPSVVQEMEHVQLIPDLIAKLEGINSFEETSLKVFLKEFSKSHGVKFAELMMMMRSMLSGLHEGPGVAEMMVLLGKDQSLVRLRAFLR